MLLDLTLGDVTGLWFVLPGWVVGGGGNGHHITLSLLSPSTVQYSESVQLTASSVSLVSVSQAPELSCWQAATPRLDKTTITTTLHITTPVASPDKKTLHFILSYRSHSYRCSSFPVLQSVQVANLSSLFRQPSSPYV